MRAGLDPARWRYGCCLGAVEVTSRRFQPASSLPAVTEMKKSAIEIGFGITLGAGLGMALAVILGSTGLWLAVGVVLGVGVGSGWMRRKIGAVSNRVKN
jgi:F0F1-type ATP synthase assembly protein I